jgi:hypothetical protein
MLKPDRAQEEVQRAPVPEPRRIEVIPTPSENRLLKRACARKERCTNRVARRHVGES